MTPSAEQIAGRLLQRALDAEKPARLQVQGGCMEPLIRDGDWVEVRPRDRVENGSVVVARDGSGLLVCHRVLARAGETLRLAGDRSPTAQEYASGSLLGGVRSVERGGLKLRLDGWLTRGPDRLLAGLHRLSQRCRGLPGGRAIEVLRRALLEGRGLSWLASDAARRVRAAGTSRRCRPASSR